MNYKYMEGIRHCPFQNTIVAFALRDEILSYLRWFRGRDLDNRLSEEEMTAHPYLLLTPRFLVYLFVRTEIIFEYFCTCDTEELLLGSKYPVSFYVIL